MTCACERKKVLLGCNDSKKDGDEKKEMVEKSGGYMIICYLCTRIEEKSR
jgi:hypothetical protein